MYFGAAVNAGRQIRTVVALLVLGTLLLTAAASEELPVSIGTDTFYLGEQVLFTLRSGSDVIIRIDDGVDRFRFSRGEPLFTPIREGTHRVTVHARSTGETLQELSFAVLPVPITLDRERYAVGDEVRMTLALAEGHEYRLTLSVGSNEYRLLDVEGTVAFLPPEEGEYLIALDDLTGVQAYRKRFAVDPAPSTAPLPSTAGVTVEHTRLGLDRRFPAVVFDDVRFHSDTLRHDLVARGPGENRVEMRGIREIAAIEAFSFSADVPGTATYVLTVENVTLDNATIRLAKGGDVAAVARCDDLDETTGACPGGWIPTDLPFADHGGYIEFTVDHFTSYGGIPATDKWYVTSTTTTQTPSMAASRDTTENSYQTFFSDYTLYNVMNASVTVTGRKIETTDVVSFSSYWTNDAKVDNAAYATFKLYYGAAAPTTLICQDGGDTTNAHVLVDASSHLLTGSCSPSSDVTVPNGTKLWYVINVYTGNVGSGADSYLKWDTATADTWVQVQSINQVVINVTTNASTAYEGGTINASGELFWMNMTPIAGATINVSFYNSTGDLKQSMNVTTDANGNYWSNYTTSMTVEPGDWMVNVTGWYNSTDYATSSTTFTVVGFGTLVVNITSQDAIVTQNETFWLNATVTCTGRAGATCGEVSALARYSLSSLDPNTAINMSSGVSPFFVVKPSHLYTTRTLVFHNVTNATDFSIDIIDNDSFVVSYGSANNSGYFIIFNSNGSTEYGPFSLPEAAYSSVAAPWQPYHSVAALDNDSVAVHFINNNQHTYYRVYNINGTAELGATSFIGVSCTGSIIVGINETDIMNIFRGMYFWIWNSSGTRISPGAISYNGGREFDGVLVDTDSVVVSTILNAGGFDFSVLNVNGTEEVSNTSVGTSTAYDVGVNRINDTLFAYDALYSNSLHHYVYHINGSLRNSSTSISGISNDARKYDGALLDDDSFAVAYISTANAPLVAVVNIYTGATEYSSKVFDTDVLYPTVQRINNKTFALVYRESNSSAKIQIVALDNNPVNYLLDSGHIWNVTFLVNATGAMWTDYYLDVNVSSNYVQITPNETSDVHVCIGACPVSPSIAAGINVTSPVVNDTAINVSATVVDPQDDLDSVWLTVTPPVSAAYNVTLQSSGSSYWNDSIVLDEAGSWTFTFHANDTSGNNATPTLAQDQIGNAFVRVFAAFGRLNVSINAPSDPTVASLNGTFTLNATVTCEGVAGASCGDVTALARYGGMASSPTTAISTTGGATPLHLMPTYGLELNATNFSGSYDPTLLAVIPMDDGVNITFTFRSSNGYYSVHNSSGDELLAATTSSGIPDEVTGVAVDNETVVLAYRRTMPSNLGMYTVNLINGTELYSPNAFGTGDATYIDLAAIDSDSVVFAYVNGGGRFSVINIDGTPEVAETSFSSGSTESTSVTMVDSNSFAIAYSDTAGQGNYTVRNINGNQELAPTVFYASDTYETVIAAVDSDSVAIAFFNNSGDLLFTVRNVNGDEELAPTRVGNTSNAPALTALDSDSVVIAYVDADTSEDLLVVYNVDGTLELGPVVFYDGAGTALSAEMLDEDSVVIGLLDTKGLYVIYDLNVPEENPATVSLDQGESFDFVVTVKATGENETEQELDVRFNSSLGSNVPENDTEDVSVCLGACWPGPSDTRRYYLSGTMNAQFSSLSLTRDGVMNQWQPMSWTVGQDKAHVSGGGTIEGIYLRTSDLVSFNTYWVTSNKVDFAYATYVFSQSESVCYVGDHSTGGPQVPDGGSAIISGTCSPTQDLEIPNGSSIHFYNYLYVSSASGTISAEIQWDTATANTSISFTGVQRTTINVTTDQSAFLTSETVNATGRLSWLNGSAVANDEVTVVFLDPDGDVKQTSIVTTDSEGEYDVTYSLGPDPEQGVWRVNVSSEMSVLLSPTAEKQFLVEKLGTLSVALLAPSDPAVVAVGGTFWLNGSMTCQGEDGSTCGYVFASARYNDSLGIPDTLINASSGGEPLFLHNGTKGPVANATVTGFNFSVDTQVGTPVGVYFNGSHHFVLSFNPVYVFRYNRSGDYDGWNFSVAGQDSLPSGITGNGSHFFVTGETSESVYEYDHDGNYTGFNFSVAGEDVDPVGIALDDSRFYVLFNDRIVAYTRTGVYAGTTIDLSSDDSWMEDLSLYEEYLYAVGSGTNRVFEYLTNGTATGNSFSVAAQEDNPFALHFNGTHFLVSGSQKYYVHEYEALLNLTPQNPRFRSLRAGDSWNVSWLVNATGVSGSSYELDVNFTSSYGNSLVPNNDTSDATLCIGTCQDSGPPSILNLSVPVSVMPVMGQNVSVSLNFSAEDPDGAGDLDHAAAFVNVSRGGVSRVGLCDETVINATVVEYNCTVSVPHYDEAGTWLVNVSVTDNASLEAHNGSESYSLDTLLAIELGVASYSFGTLTPGVDGQAGLGNPLIVDNKGNVKSPR